MSRWPERGPGASHLVVLLFACCLAAATCVQAQEHDQSDQNLRIGGAHSQFLSFTLSEYLLYKGITTAPISFADTNTAFCELNRLGCNAGPEEIAEDRATKDALDVAFLDVEPPAGSFGGDFAYAHYGIRAIAAVHSVAGLHVPLVLTPSVLARIFRPCNTSHTPSTCQPGSITHWNDSDILATNPSISWPALNAAGEIKVAANLAGSYSEYWFKDFAARADSPAFADHLGAFVNTTAGFGPSVAISGKYGAETTLATAFYSTPNLIGILPMSSVIYNDLGGKIIGLTTSTYIMAVYPSGPGLLETLSDIENVKRAAAIGDVYVPNNDRSWPLYHNVWAGVRPAERRAGSTCEARTLATVYLEFLFGDYGMDPGLQSIGYARSTTTASELKTAILDTLTCDGVLSRPEPKPLQVATIWLPDMTTTGGVLQLLNFYYTSHLRVDGLVGVTSSAAKGFTTQFLEVPTSSLEHFREALKPDQVSVAILGGSYPFSAEDKLQYFRAPFAAISYLFIYNLCGESTDELATCTPSDIDLDVGLFVDIMRGNVSKWNDPRLVARNPGADLPDEYIELVPLPDGQWQENLRYFLLEVSGHNVTVAGGGPGSTFAGQIARVSATRYSATVSIPKFIRFDTDNLRYATVNGNAGTPRQMDDCLNDTWSLHEERFKMDMSLSDECYPLSMTLDFVMLRSMEGAACGPLPGDEEFENDLVGMEKLEGLGFIVLEPPPTRSLGLEVTRFLEWTTGERRNYNPTLVDLYDSFRKAELPYISRQRFIDNHLTVSTASFDDPSPVLLNYGWTVTSNPGHTVVVDDRFTFHPVTRQRIPFERASWNEGTNETYLTPSLRRQVARTIQQQLGRITCRDTSRNSSLLTARVENLVPLSLEILNDISEDLTLFGRVFVVLMGLTYLLLAFWIYKYERARIVRFASPPFLYLMLLGAALMAGSTLLVSYRITSYDRVYGFDPEEIARMDQRCLALPWLYSSGFALTFGALYAKTWRLVRIFENVQLKEFRITTRQMMMYPIMILLLYVPLNLAWTLNPATRLQYDRVVIQVSTTSRQVVKSAGMCTSTDGNVWIGLGPLVLLTLLLLLFGFRFAYAARNLPSEFNEAPFIAAAMGVQCLAFVALFPVMALVADSPDASFILRLIFASISSLGPVLLIMAPKFWIVYRIGDSSALKSGNKSSQDKPQGSKDNVADKESTSKMVVPTAMASISDVGAALKDSALKVKTPKSGFALSSTSPRDAWPSEEAKNLFARLDEPRWVAHCEQQFVVENLNFLRDLKSIKATFYDKSETTRGNKYKTIFTRYLAIGGPNEINVSDSCRHQIIDALAKPGGVPFEAFDVAEKEVVGMLLHGPWRSYLAALERRELAYREAHGGKEKSSGFMKAIGRVLRRSDSDSGTPTIGQEISSRGSQSSGGGGNEAHAKSEHQVVDIEAQDSSDGGL